MKGWARSTVQQDWSGSCSSVQTTQTASQTLTTLPSNTTSSTAVTCRLDQITRCIAFSWCSSSGYIVHKTKYIILRWAMHFVLFSCPHSECLAKRFFFSTFFEKLSILHGVFLVYIHTHTHFLVTHCFSCIYTCVCFCISVCLQVINCTTPSNYFHALRRQVKKPFRKPVSL